MKTSFPRYVLEQDFHEQLVLLAIAAGAYFAVVAVVVLLLRRGFGLPVPRVVLVATAGVLAVAVVGITVFEATARWYRPDGAGIERDYDDYVVWARAAFVVLYAGLALLAAGTGFAFGRRRDGRGVVTAIATGGAVVVFLLLTLPVVEFLNACNVGQSFILEDGRC